jgi:anti-sigma regulatory factor (Ser/Thr protein kinase)
MDLHLVPGPRAPAEARRSVSESLDRVGSETVSTVRLLVSELVTNSVRHAGLARTDRIGLRVVQAPNLVHVTVTDPGVGFEPSAEPHPGSTSGWGLFLVDHLADRWGVHSNGHTRVWFELRC